MDPDDLDVVMAVVNRANELKSEQDIALADYQAEQTINVLARALKPR